MPVLYVYSPDDFVGGLPDEANASADGKGPFTLTLKEGATPTRVEVYDDDAIFDEVDDSQFVSEDVKIDGQGVEAGTTINSSYDLIDSSSGLKVTSLHFGTDGYVQGPVDGLVATEPLEPGKSYTFDVERTSHQKYNPYKDYVPCFTPGCAIALGDGRFAPVEALRPGDRILTQDHALQPVRAVLRRRVAAEGMRAPVHLPVGVLGNRRALRVSPQHRFLLSGGRLELMTDLCEAFVPAIRFVEAGQARQVFGGEVTYLHLVLDRHEVIFADGARTESFLPSAQHLLPPALRQELHTVFPEIATRDPGSEANTCRPLLRRWEALSVLATR